MQPGTVTVTVTASPTLICTLASEGDGVVIQNSGSSPVFVGDSAVAASGANAGVSVAADATLTSGVRGGGAAFDPQLYGVVASGSTTVAFIAPAGQGGHTMDEHYLAMMALHEGLARMSDNPLQFRGKSPSVRLMEQVDRAWRQAPFGPDSKDIMRVPF